MARILKEWKEERVSDLPLADHRYTDDLDDSYVTATGKAWRAGVPYKPGEVFYVLHNGAVKRARIYHVILTFTRLGDRLEMYRCALETKAGFFSRQWSDFYPGHVQRGYEASATEFATSATPPDGGASMQSEEPRS